MDPAFITSVVRSEAVTLRPNQLTTEYKTFIVDEIKRKFVNTHTKDGFILDARVISTSSIGSIGINNGAVSFTALVEFYMFIPEVGRMYTATVKNVLKDKLIVNVFEIMDVLIIVNDMVYNDATKTVEKGKKVIGCDDKVKIKLLTIPYSQRKFSCNAVLV